MVRSVTVSEGHHHRLKVQITSIRWLQIMKFRLKLLAIDKILTLL